VLIDANLRGANRRDSDLRNADLSGADLSHADLTGAQVDGTIFVGANLRGTNFERTNVTRRQLESGTLDAATKLPSTLDDLLVAVVPTYRGDGARSGKQSGPGPAGDALSETWRFVTRGGTLSTIPFDRTGLTVTCSGPAVMRQPLPIASSPAVATIGKRLILYVTSEDGCLYAVDAASGRLYWDKPFKAWGGVIESSPAVFDGYVYFTTSNGYLRAVDANTGVQRWSQGEISRFSSPVIGVVGGRPTLYVGGSDRLVALDALTGKPKAGWRVEVDEGCAKHPAVPVWSSPALVDGVVYFGTTGGCVIAADATTGQTLWSLGASERGTCVDSAPVQTYMLTPAVVEGSVYISSDDGALYALDAETGAIRWCWKTLAAIVFSSPTAVDGIVYVSDSGGWVYALDATDGGHLWSRNVSARIRSSPVVADDRVYVGTASQGRGCPATGTETPTANAEQAMTNPCGIVVLAARTGRVVVTVGTEGDVMEAPVVIDGAIYAGDSDGILYEIR
jgi:outer membrane protein assembly factor BamB